MQQVMMGIRTVQEMMTLVEVDAGMTSLHWFSEAQSMKDTLTIVASESAGSNCMIRSG